MNFSQEELEIENEFVKINKQLFNELNDIWREMCKSNCCSLTGTEKGKNNNDLKTRLCDGLDKLYDFNAKIYNDLNDKQTQNKDETNITKFQNREKSWKEIEATNSLEDIYNVLCRNKPHHNSKLFQEWNYLESIIYEELLNEDEHPNECDRLIKQVIDFLKKQTENIYNEINTLNINQRSLEDE